MHLPHHLRSAKARAAVFLSAVLLALAAAIGTGLGTKLLDRLQGEQVVSASSEAELYSCGTPLFFTAPKVREILAEPPPDRKDWAAFNDRFGGASVSFGSVLVSIQGETSRPITLTRIAIIAVDRKRRRAGATFTNPCGGPLTGRQIVFDLDRPGEPVVNSAEAPDAILGAHDSAGRPYRPIRLPWTVSLDDPLLLRIVAQTKRCNCTWSAGIDWRSGDKSGEIRVDNGGDGYRVVGLAGVRGVRGYISDTRGGDRWLRNRPPQR
jgi:hypothetical protein